LKTLSPDLPKALRNKMMWRLAPFLALLYLLNIVDRNNVGFAKLTMIEDLKMSKLIFNIGAGIFYFGYFFFEVPANLMLRRVGARRWIARIMISWGFVSCLTAAVTGPWSFYGVRILLGIAEAGFFPGIVLYLTFWFPSRERAKVMALFMTGVAISGIVSNPISGAIMQNLNGVWGLTGWQWLFLLEGLPSILVGFAVLFCLPDNPSKASWLTESEREEVLARLRREDVHREQTGGAHSWRWLLDPRVALLTGVYFTLAVGSNAAGYYFPGLIKGLFPKYGPQDIGWLAALPSVCALFGMLAMGRFSDATGKRRLSVAICATTAAIGWTVVATASVPWLGLVGLCVALTGMLSMLPTFWVLPTTFLSGTAAAAGIALINSIANLGGLLGYVLIDEVGPFSMVVVMLAGAGLVFLVRHDSTLDRPRDFTSERPESR